MPTRQRQISPPGTMATMAAVLPIELRLYLIYYTIDFDISRLCIA
jgi:hypothetical protein